MTVFATFLAETQAAAYPGVADVDAGQNLENNLTLPWVFDPEVSWLDYRCTIEVHLDPGTALHKPLPQGQPQQNSTYPPIAAIDTLGSFDVNSPYLNAQTDGVHTVSAATFQDIVQQMATPLWRFCLRGYALRAGYQIPIPKLLKVAGVPAIPANPQFAFNDLAGNYSGVPLWFAQWELWYYVAVPPKGDLAIPANLARHITADEPVPESIAVPASQPDQHAVTAIQQNPPANLVGFPVQGKK